MTSGPLSTQGGSSPFSSRSWVCRACGPSDAKLTITNATVDVSVILFCPACGCEMFRDDALGQIESEADQLV